MLSGKIVSNVLNITSIGIGNNGRILATSMTIGMTDNNI